MNPSSDPQPTRRLSVPAWLRGALVVVVLVVVLLAVSSAGLTTRVEGWMKSFKEMGWIGWLLFVVLYAAACVLFVPGSLLTLGAGAVFGVGLGSALVSVGSVVGATLSFLVGRFLARGWVTRKAAANPRFAALDAAIGREGWKIVGLLRLSPVIPFNLLNYLLGVTRVSLRDYVLASWIGMMPGTVMYVYLGSVFGLAAGGGTREKSAAEWSLYVFGLIATAGVTIWITLLAKKALARRLDSPSDPQSPSTR